MPAPLLLAVLAQSVPEPVDFAREVRPILSDRCFQCHGPDAASREADLRLDERASAVAAREGGAAIVPGDPSASRMIARIAHPEREERMPPPHTGLRVEAEERELLERWIAEGAPYAAHWAFVPPERAAAPAVLDADWPRDALDHFVLARLEAEGLAPAPAVEPALWLRRASFVLTGLPPSLEELDAFLAEPESEERYARAVDRLLASPHHGEHLAADWLDVARYADTWGYQADVFRRVWPWRDWVIQAFNANLPWDEFATQQIAGDLLPEPTRETRLATAFSRLHRMTNEGGSVEEEFRVESVADRTHTFGTAFLGLTFECARCHDHKYDPLPQTDYYGLFAYFDDIDESGLYSHFTNGTPTPELLLSTPEQDARLAELGTRIAAAEAELAQLAVPAFALQDARGWYRFEEREGALTNGADAERAASRFEGAALVEGADGLAVRTTGEDGVRFGEVGAFRRWEPFSFALRIAFDEVQERAIVLHRSRAWTDAASCGSELLLLDGHARFSLIHFWPGDAISIETEQPLAAGAWHHLTLTYDGSSRADGLRIYVDGEPAAVRVVRDHLTQDIVSGGGLQLTLAQRFRDNGYQGLTDDLFVAARELGPAEARTLARGGELDLPQSDPPGAEAWRAAQAALLALRKERDELTDRIPGIVTMRDMAQPRVAHRLERGHYEGRAEVVSAHVPGALGTPDAQPANRLELARWLTDPQHPLFARTTVNRLWAHAFGSGLVRSAENFGSQGTPPTHPALLDTLARDFVDSGFDGKALLRRLVLSSTFRQSARGDAALVERDPDNALLARGPSRRLTAEMTRDLALAASGLLVRQVGGPPKKPWQPEGLWHDASGQRYQRDGGAGSWRRSLYTFWKRTVPPPSMMLFDASAREVCQARRHSTQTPLQALAQWNDPQYAEAMRALAQTLLSESVSEAERLERLWRRLCARAPEPREKELLRHLLADLRTHYADHPAEAQAYLEHGDVDALPELSAEEVAAWGSLGATVLSSDAARTLR